MLNSQASPSDVGIMVPILHMRKLRYRKNMPCFFRLPCCRNLASFTLPQVSLFPGDKRQCSLVKKLYSIARRRRIRGGWGWFLGPCNLTLKGSTKSQIKILSMFRLFLWAQQDSMCFPFVTATISHNSSHKRTTDIIPILQMRKWRLIRINWSKVIECRCEIWHVWYPEPLLLNIILFLP